MAARNRKAEFKYTHDFIDALFAGYYPGCAG
jgi:hypothetical protein